MEDTEKETLTLSAVSRKVGVRDEAVKRILSRLEIDAGRTRKGAWQIPKSALPEIKEEADRIHTRLNRARKDVDLSNAFKEEAGDDPLHMKGETMRMIRQDMTEMLDAEVSQGVLGDLLGHQQPTISNYESGNAEVPAQTSFALWLAYHRMRNTPNQMLRDWCVTDPEA